jgi:TRAP-type C4-dicarboxylate transport system permease small subunit
MFEKSWLMNILKLIDLIILNTLKAVTIACFVILTVLVSANVLVRFFPVASLHWFDEIIELVVAALIFYGSAALWITREHFGVGDWIGKRLAPRLRQAYHVVIELLALVFVAVFFYYSYALANSAEDVTNAFAIPKWILYSCLPISAAIMIIYSFRKIMEEIGAIWRHPNSRR